MAENNSEKNIVASLQKLKEYTVLMNQELIILDVAKIIEK